MAVFFHIPMTTYYRILTDIEIEDRRYKMLRQMIDMKITPEILISNLEKSHFDEYKMPWDTFMDEIVVPICSKTITGDFIFYLNEQKYYTNKAELIDFIKSGQIVDNFFIVYPLDLFISEILDLQTEITFYNY